MTTIQKSKQAKNADEHKEIEEIRHHNEPVEESNKSVIHVVPLVAKHNIAPKTIMVPIKNITVIKTLVNNEGTKNKKIKIVGKPEVYQKRKDMLNEYKELFAAIMKFSDKEMQKKLLNVINNHPVIEQRSVETQTEPVEFKDSCQTVGEETNNSKNEIETINTISSEIQHSGEVIRKRKRKRKVSLPQANKESRAKQLAKMNKPKTSVSANGNVALSPDDDTNDSPGSAAKRQRGESLCLSEYSVDVANIVEDMHKTTDKESELYDKCLENGLLPIQDAVVRNQTNSLSVHIAIWKNMGVDLNDILTEEDEDELQLDLLQLAVLNTSVPLIISMLLENNLNPNTLDAESNTIIHLAILNDITVPALEHLMKRIDLKLLLTLNDDGYTPLHLAIRQDRYLLVECLINILDERLVNKIYYKRQLDELETDENLIKKQFKDYYEKICLQMISDEEAVTIDNHEFKQRLLQAGDRRSGNTALYFAIDNSFEHLAYFLLAHLTDPRTQSLSGIDCKSYFSEYGKSLNLSLNIDNAMEKVIKLLS